MINYGLFNNKLVAAFTTTGIEQSVSFHCLTFSFMFRMLKNTFTTFLRLSSQVFRCLDHTNILPGCDPYSTFSHINTKSTEAEACSLQRKIYDSDSAI